jgi:hypothetical protein
LPLALLRSLRSLDSKPCQPPLAAFLLMSLVSLDLGRLGSSLLALLAD